MDSVYNLLITFRAEGTVVFMSGDIANINKFYPLFYSYIPCLLKCLYWSRWQMGHLIGRKESYKMKGYICTEIFFYPYAHLSDVFHIII